MSHHVVFEPELESGLLEKRYKRFLADVMLHDELTTIYCPNTGSMLHCDTPGSRVWVSYQPSSTRKYPYTWELAEINGAMIGINTHRANEIVHQALKASHIPELAQYGHIEREVPYGVEKSRIDFCLSDEAHRCYVEVKSVTLADGGVGYFPDAVTTRGQKHLRELMAVVEQGQRAVLFYCVQHTAVNSVKPAEHIDPVYADLVQQAVASGVEILAYGVNVTPEGLSLSDKLPFYTD